MIYWVEQAQFDATKADIYRAPTPKQHTYNKANAVRLIRVCL